MLSTRDKLEKGVFENNVPFPDTAFMKDKAHDIDVQMKTLQERLVELQKERKNLMIEQKTKYREEEARITKAVRISLEEEYNLRGHPKSDRLWGRAWEDGHASGYGEVINIYEDLVELIK